MPQKSQAGTRRRAIETRTETESPEADEHRRCLILAVVGVRTGQRPGWLAEDAGFEPARAVNPTRFPSERHRPLGESSAEEGTGAAPSGEIRRTPVDWSAANRSPRLPTNPPRGGIMPNSPRAGRQQG